MKKETIYDFPRVPNNEELFKTSIDWEAEEKECEEEDKHKREK